MTRVAIIGAGPYGLSIAAHLRSYGVPFRIFGTPLDGWRRHMPVGMMLKSDGFASSLSDPDGEGTLAEYCAERRIPYHDTDIPVSLELFNAYALDFQQRFVEDLEERHVVSLDRNGDGFVLELDDGEVLQPDFVVGAFGITYFARIPPELEHLPTNLMSHSSAHSDLSGFSGRDVTVIGGGSSAVDIATLLHEVGAQTSLVARSTLKFTPTPTPGPRSRWQRIRNPSSGLGPSPRLWAYQKFPHLFRYLTGQARLTHIRRVLGPQTPSRMRARLEAGVVVAIGESIEHASEEDGRVRLVLRSQDGNKREILTDHVIAATGYYPKLSSVDFLSEDLRSSIRTHAEMPMVSAKFESSVSGLYFVGLLAVNSFGPLMRFIVGAEYAAPRVARQLARRVRQLEPEGTPKSGRRLHSVPRRTDAVVARQSQIQPAMNDHEEQRSAL
jgi:cation diffusion facilitator CzcD-associated flavoprotein CzcO